MKNILIFTLLIITVVVKGQYLTTMNDTSVTETIQLSEIGGHSDFRVETEQEIIYTKTFEKAVLMAGSLGFASDSVLKNKPRIVFNNNAIKNDTALLLDLMREYYKRPWSLVGDAGKLTFISSDGLSYRNINSSLLDRIITTGKFYDFRLYIIIPANQLNVAKTAGLPGNGATWGEFANRSKLILKRANGGIMIPLWNAKKSWFNSNQIKQLTNANLNISRLTDKNFENQLANNTWFKVNVVTEDITGRVDYYQYSNFNP